MGYPTRIYYSESDCQKIFDRWLAGESQNAIARSFGRSHSSIQGVLARTGGIRPEAAAQPHVNPRVLQ
ncbi:MAG: helix-turn-helix domain-containing protein [Planctomycetota bacterium]|jgi:IS30 family transposase